MVCLMGRGGVFESGLFSAAVGSGNEVMNDFCWVRDNYYMWLTGGDEVKRGVARGFYVLDFWDAGFGDWVGGKGSGRKIYIPFLAHVYIKWHE